MLRTSLVIVNDKYFHSNVLNKYMILGESIKAILLLLTSLSCYSAPNHIKLYKIHHSIDRGV